MVRNRLSKSHDAKFIGDNDAGMSLDLIDSVSDAVGRTDLLDGNGCAIGSVDMATGRLGKCGIALMGGYDVRIPIHIIDRNSDFDGLVVGFKDLPTISERPTNMVKLHSKVGECQ